MKKIILCSTLKSNPIFNNTQNIISVNPNNHNQMIKKLNNIIADAIEIYDYTYNLKHIHNEIIPVSDHINRTGDNPLIGNQNQISKPFIDISKLYSSSKGVTTDCLGKYFNKHKKKYKYPSKYLCYASIVATALNNKKIKAFLINNLGQNKIDAPICNISD